MRNTIIMLLAISAIMLIIGYINAADIEACINKGNSEELCNRTFNR